MRHFIGKGEKVDIDTFYKDKLASVLFLEVSRDAVKRIFNIDEEMDICLPARSSNIVDKVKEGNNLEAVPTDLLVEGMFFVLGGDSDFKYNKEYISILSRVPGSNAFIKGIIFGYVKKEQLEDAFILLKGLLRLEQSTENYDKIITLLENLRIKNKAFRDEEINILKSAKKIEGYARPFIYEAVIYKEKGDMEKALSCLDKYISKGGEETPEITDLKCSLKSILDYEKGKELVYSDPEKALRYLIPLMDQFGDDAALFFYVAVCYRMITNYEKAIYYLNESLSIDNNLVEVVNELGINYASLGRYEEAINYFRKAFEVTRNIEICTNLIMCYLNVGNMDQAQKHLDIAKRLDPNDEIVKKLENIIKIK